MKIKKMYQGSIPENKILNTYSGSKTDTYSCDYINNISGNPSGGGGSGENGATFTPNVDSDGNLSWTNDKGLSNPTTVNIKGPDGYTPVKGTDYYTEEDKEEMIQRLESAMSEVYGVVFDEFPTEEQIIALPNKTFFTVRAYGSVDAQNKIATYYRTTSWTRNALTYTNGTSTIYVVPVNQAAGEIYLPYYGIKTGEANAESNSAIMTILTSTAQYGSTFRFPVGHFYFSEPIDASGGHFSILGTTNASFKNTALWGTTFLHFNNLADGEIALKVEQCTISDFNIFGTSEQYSLTLTRNNESNDLDPVVSETIGVKAYGIYAHGCMNIRNIGTRYFYYGIWCETSNMAISNISIHNCHYGISVDCDVKIFNLFGWEAMVLLQMRGSLSSAVGVRGDSIGNHLVEITGGGNHTLVDLDADFCMDSIVAIGDGVTSSSICDLNITGIHGRSGVRHFFFESDEEITANDVTEDTVGEFGVITIKEGSTLNGAIITTNQSISSENNPFDGNSTKKVPFILLTAGAGTTVKGVQFFSTSYTGDELTEEWAKKRITSFSALPNACDVKIQIGSGSIKYQRSNGVISVIDDAADIYKRMDKSALALSGEVVKTVNGVQPDDDGNVQVVQEEPEVVQSIDECVDTSKRYVLPDGYIYAYRKKFVPGGTFPNFINQLPISLDPLTESGVLNSVGYKQNVLYSLDTTNKCITESTTSTELYSTGLIPVKEGDIVRINAMGYHTTSGTSIMCAVRDDKSAVGSIRAEILSSITDGGGKYTSTGQWENGVLSDVEIYVNDGTFGWITQYGNVNYMWFAILNTTPPEDVIITVNQEITYTVIEDKYEWNWESTGELYVKPDYLGMINELEARIEALENTINA